MNQIPRPDAVSDHAIDRFIQRFPGEDFEAAFARSVPLPLETLRRWAASNGRPYGFNRDNTVWWDAETGCAFICKQVNGGKCLVVTVYPARKPKVVRARAVEQRRHPYSRDRNRVGYDPEGDDDAD